MSPSEPSAGDVAAALDALEGALPVGAVGLVLGTGLGGFAERLDPRVSIAYAEIPGFPGCRAAGHPGMFHAGRLSERDVVVFEGRTHLYEGATVNEVTFAVRLLAAIEARAVLLTTAAGGVNPAYRVGDLVLVRDHLNLTGSDPLRGIPREPRQRPGIAGAPYYHPVLVDRLAGLAFSLSVRLHRGVLAGVAGPSHETPAELRALAVLGADAVSRSTVVEVIAAAYARLPAAALAVVTSTAGATAATDHQAVLEAATRASGPVADFLVTVIEELNWTL